MSVRHGDPDIRRVDRPDREGRSSARQGWAQVRGVLSDAVSRRSGCRNRRRRLRGWPPPPRSPHRRRSRRRVRPGRHPVVRMGPAGTTTCADFCPVSSRLTAEAAGAATRQHNRHPGRSPRIGTINFPCARRVYVTTLLMVTGFTSLSRLTQIAPPCTRFVFPGAGFRLGLPSHPASRRRSCLRLGVSTTSSSRGLPPPIDRPCQGYSRRPAARRRVRRSPRRALHGGPPGAPAPSHRRAAPVITSAQAAHPG